MHERTAIQPETLVKTLPALDIDALYLLFKASCAGLPSATLFTTNLGLIKVVAASPLHRFSLLTLTLLLHLLVPVELIKSHTHSTWRLRSMNSSPAKQSGPIRAAQFQRTGWSFPAFNLQRKVFRARSNNPDLIRDLKLCS